MPESPSLFLPVELIDLIIDHIGLNNDHPALRSFSLTNHHFAQSCQEHLFRKISTVTNSEHDTISGAYGRQQPLELLGTVTRQNPTLASYVRHLEVARNLDNYVDFSCVKSLDRVENFSFGHSKGLGEGKYEPDSEFHLLCNQRSFQAFVVRNPIRDLRLTNITWFPLTIFSTMPLLQHLELEFFSTWDDRNFSEEEENSEDTNPSLRPPIAESPPVQLPRLARLGIYMHTSVLVAKMIDFSGIQTLKLKLLQVGESVEYLPQILPQIRRLEVLDIEFARLEQGPLNTRIIPHLSETSLGSLRSFSITLAVENGWYGHFPPFAGLKREFSQLSHRNVLEEISLSVVVSTASGLDTSPEAWNVLEEPLSTGFEKLKRLSISIHLSFFDDDDIDSGTRKKIEEIEKLLKNSLLWTRAASPLVVAAEVTSTII